MGTASNAVHRAPWNKGKLVGQKAPFKLKDIYSFTGDPAVGNTILIRNLSSRPQIVTHWELLYCTGRWPRRKFERFEGTEYDDGDRRLEPHSTLTLRFAEAHYFDWGSKALNGRSIYIRLYFAGRRAVIFKVYAQ